MIKIKTKDHLVYFMQSGMMKLSNYDLKFVQNLNTVILQHKPITTNQTLLFDKLISKYKKQLSKHKYSVQFLMSLPWTVDIVESSSEYTEVHISIENNKIFIRCPFNKKFVTEFRKIEYNPFKWDNENKRYESEYSTRAFKIAHNTIPKFYSKVNYCDTASALINRLSNYSPTDIWEPTLVEVNGRYLIGATNQFVQPLIENIELNTDVKTLSYLSEICVRISDNLAKDNRLNFANSVFYETQIDDLGNVFNWLKELGCDCIFFSGLSNPLKKNNVFDTLKELGIHHYNQSDMIFSLNPSVYNSYNYIVNIYFNVVRADQFSYLKHNAKKIIKVHNGFHIDIV